MRISTAVMKEIALTKKLISVAVAILAFGAFSSQVFCAPDDSSQKPRKPQPQAQNAQKRNSVENFQRYEEANKSVAKPPIAVFMGDSITDNWARMDKDFFEKNNYIGRGISGQVTCQMLARLRPDAIELKPKIVLILAGTNDIARNQGYITNENICKNIVSMCELLKHNGIIPVICSVLPAHKYKWRPNIDAVPAIADLNSKLKAYAQSNGIEYLDYYSALVDERKGLTTEDSADGVHPTASCYREKMGPMAKAKIDEILKK